MKDKIPKINTKSENNYDLRVAFMIFLGSVAKSYVLRVYEGAQTNKDFFLHVLTSTVKASTKGVDVFILLKSLAG
jgi:hypothetical protein